MALIAGNEAWLAGSMIARWPMAAECLAFR